jgi:kynureninase
MVKIVKMSSINEIKELKKRINELTEYVNKLENNRCPVCKMKEHCPRCHDCSGSELLCVFGCGAKFCTICVVYGAVGCERYDCDCTGTSGIGACPECGSVVMHNGEKIY